MSKPYAKNKSVVTRGRVTTMIYVQVQKTSPIGENTWTSIKKKGGPRYRSLPARIHPAGCSLMIAHCPSSEYCGMESTLRGLAGNKLPSLMRFFFVYEKEKLSHIIIWRSFSDEVHGEKDIKIGKLFTAKSLSQPLSVYFL